MLILSRKAGERIHIADDIVVHVQAIRGDKVRLALDVPEETLVLRGEAAEDPEAAARYRARTRKNQRQNGISENTA